MQIDTVNENEIINLAMSSGHNLMNMPTRCGKCLGDLTKGEVQEEATHAISEDSEDRDYLKRLLEWAESPVV